MGHAPGRGPASAPDEIADWEWKRIGNWRNDESYTIAGTKNLEHGNWKIWIEISIKDYNHKF